MLSISTLTQAISVPNSSNWNNLTEECGDNYGTDRIVEESQSCAGAKKTRLLHFPPNCNKIPILFYVSFDIQKVITSKITYEMIGLLECCKLCTFFFCKVHEVKVFFLFIYFFLWQPPFRAGLPKMTASDRCRLDQTWTFRDWSLSHPERLNHIEGSVLAKGIRYRLSNGFVSLFVRWMLYVRTLINFCYFCNVK